MTKGELKQIEEKLQLKLPAAYRQIMSAFPEELHEWPPLEGQDANRPIEDFLLDVNEIVKAQKAARKRLGHALPPHSFVFGRNGANYWLIDASADDPPVQLVFDGMLLDGPPNLAAHLERVQANHREAWEKARRRAEAGAVATLTADTLIAEGRKLARPAVLLVDRGKEYAAVWGGTGVVPPPEGEWEHRVSIDTRFLPSNPRKLKGVISVYLCIEDSERFHQVAVTHHAKAALPAKPDGERLYARPVESLPPLEALFKFGGPTIQKWLAAHSVDPNHGINPACFGKANQAAIGAYYRLVEAEHPFFGNVDCAAMLGGWSMCFMWCYGIDEPYPWHVFDAALIVLTARDAEPWIEVFDDGKQFETYSRIT